MNKRLIASVLAAALILPTAAIAADMIAIDSEVFTQEEHPDGTSGPGSNGGTWSWDGKDELTLTDYDGGPVAAHGDIEIKLEGENTVTSHNQDAIFVWGEDAQLTITGEGSLTADMTVDSYEFSHPLEGYGDPNSDGYIDLRQGNIGAINNLNGDTEIRDTTVVANSRFEGLVDNSVCSAISNYDGELRIINSQVEAAWYVDHDMTYGHGNACIYTSGTAVVDNSNFDIKVVPLREVPESYSTDGWYLDNFSRGESPVITINASNVHISGSTKAFKIIRIYDVERFNSEEPFSPAIALTGGSELVLPDGASFINHLRSDNPSLLYSTIGFGDGPDERGLWDEESVRYASEVLIKAPDPEPEPEPEPTPEPEPVPAPAPEPAPAPAPAPTPAPATVLPKTADATLVLEGSVAASGALLALAGILRRRR